MSPFNGPNGFWWKLIPTLLPFVAAAVFAFATLKADVANLSGQLATKEDAAVEQANQQAILRELNIIEAQLSRLEAGYSVH